MISHELIAGLQRYRDDHIPTGSFLRAVLENDLKEACSRADHTNQPQLFNIVQYIYDELPSNIWGSKEAVEAHLTKRGAPT